MQSSSAPDPQLEPPSHTLTPICPLDLSPARPLAGSTDAEVGQAVAQARRAQQAFRELTLSERASRLRTAAKRMLARRDELLVTLREEIGKVDAEAMFNETLGPLDAVNAWERVIKEHGSRERVSLNPINFPGKSAWIDLVPRGVIGVIAPWNYPVAGLYRSLFPALLMGNAVVLKPSEYSPRSSAWIVDVLASTLSEGLPPGLISAVQGGGQTGQALLSAGIDACVFTGSPATGRIVRQRCAELGIVSSIETGGKDAAIILDDCNLERTVAGVTAWALGNAGQACGAIEVAYVTPGIADTLVSRLAQVFSRLRVAPGVRGETDVAPLANRRQFDLVASHVEAAKAAGATVVCGGRPTGTGLFYEPTLIDHCTDDMAVVRDETFGPVLAIVRVEGVSDAIARINRSRYGLGASIWTRDVDRAERLAELLDVGVVVINNHALTGAMPALPWSGTRETGTGIANSRHALLTFARPKTTLVDRSEKPELYWPPYDRGLVELGEILCDVQRGAIGSAWKLPLLLHQRMSRLTAFFRDAVR